MNTPETHSLLLDQLSERLQASPELWREVFLGNTFARIRFEPCMLTLLRTDAPRCWSAGELVVLAARYGGRSEQLEAETALFSFDQPWQAARAAQALRASPNAADVECTVSTGTCTLAWFEVEGSPRRVVLPGSGTA